MGEKQPMQQMQQKVIQQTPQLQQANQERNHELHQQAQQFRHSSQTRNMASQSDDSVSQIAASGQLFPSLPQLSARSANAPEKKFAAGGISATIWANEKEVNGAPVSIRTVSLTRTYKDKDGQWKQSASMRINDIPKAQLVLDKAFEYLTLKDSSKDSTEELI